VAGFNILDKRLPYKSIPFNSLVFGRLYIISGNLRFNFVGNTEKFDDMLVEGNIDKKDFIAYYFN
jgi:hypothetical protein